MGRILSASVGEHDGRKEGEMGSVAGDSTGTIGPLLQKARAAKGLSIEAAAAASKVPLSYVRLMEQEQFHLVPDPLYLTRFLMDYAAFLGLDPKPVEAQLRGQVSSIGVAGLSHPVPSPGLRIDLRRLAMYLLPAVAVIPLIFIGLSLWSGPPPAVPPTRQPELAESQETAASLPEAVTAIPPSSQLPSLSAGRPEELPPTHPVTGPTVQEPQGPPPRYRLRAEAKDTTWLAVSADGAPDRKALLRPGETASWWANNGFIVTIGNSGGVTLSLNGRPISLKGARGQVIRNLALPANDGPPLTGP